MAFGGVWLTGMVWHRLMGEIEATLFSLGTVLSRACLAFCTETALILAWWRALHYFSRIISICWCSVCPSVFVLDVLCLLLLPSLPLQNPCKASLGKKAHFKLWITNILWSLLQASIWILKLVKTIQLRMLLVWWACATPPNIFLCQSRCHFRSLDHIVLLFCLKRDARKSPCNSQGCEAFPAFEWVLQDFSSFFSPRDFCLHR